MAKRLTDTDIWDKEWFMSLSPKLKCLTRFVFDKCDLAGVWNPNWQLAKMYIGDSVCEKELLNIDNGKQFVKLESGKFFCIDFINFQNGKLGEQSPIHKKILSLLATHNIPYPYPINRVSNTLIVDVGVIVEEKEKEKVKVKEIPSKEEFLTHCKEVLQTEYPKYEFSLISKYQTWVDDGWKTGHGKPIKNWKNTINNTIPHLKPIKNNGTTKQERIHKAYSDFLSK